MAKIIRLNRRVITIEHPDKLYFPQDHITKYELIQYYRAVAPTLLPYLHDRLMTMQRFPQGIGENGFYQKSAGEYFPAWIQRKRVRQRTGSGSNDYLLCQDTATLVYLANQGCITLHRWLSAADALDYPDTIVFDIDPPHHQAVDFPFIADIAIRIKEQIEEAGLTAWVMTTGSRGLHVAIPIKPSRRFIAVRAWARHLAEIIVGTNTQRLTLEARTEKRGKRVLIDVMRNAFGATAVVPYSVRPIPGAPIATPIEWDQLGGSKMHSQRYTIKTILDHLNQYGDAWKGMRRHARSL